MSAAGRIREAMALQRERKFAEAEAIYRGVIAASPRNVDAQQLLGYLMLQAERPADAIAPYRRALALDPQPAFRLYLGEALFLTGDLDAALPELAAAAKALPRIADAHFYLGMTLRRIGRLKEGLDALRRAVACDPGNRSQIDFLAKNILTTGRHEDGISIFTELLKENPDSGPLHYALGVSLCCLGREEEADPHLKLAVGDGIEIPEAYDLLGRCARKGGRLAESVTHFQRAIKLKPDFISAFNNLALVLAESDRLNEAVAIHCEALKINPDYVPSNNNLASCLVRQGKIAPAIQFHRRTADLAKDNPAFASNVLLTVHYEAAQTAASLLAEHRDYQARLDAYPPFEATPFTRVAPPPGARVRVGFVSGDLRTHPVAFWLEPLLRHLDRTRFELVAFANHEKDDRTSARLRPFFAEWHAVHTLGYKGALEKIRAAEVDVLIDLSGHTGKNLLPVFACRAAPVQMIMLGYPNGSGLREMDFRVTDAHADPAGVAEKWCVEELLRFERCAWCYEPPPGTPEPARTPRDNIVFGCFNNLAKIQPDVFVHWSRLLKAVPGSTLYLKSAGLQDPHLVATFHKHFATHGIGAERLRIEGRKPGIEAHLACYADMDIALDTFPYHGTTTTAEALWMGVPVVTMAGAEHRSRVGCSLLTNVGHPEWIASDWDDYISIVTRLAADTDRLDALRRDLREEMRCSPLMDGPAYAAEFAQLIDRALASKQAVSLATS